MEDYLDEHPAVQSINGKTGHVILSASDVGALPSSTAIPSKISDLTDDSGHYTKPATGIPASDMANGVIPAIDNTLTVIGAAADAKKTGDELYALKEELTEIKRRIDDIEEKHNAGEGESNG